jgi:short-subunit dehydrogenase
MNYIIFGASTGISYELVNLIIKKDKNPYFFFSSSNIENLKKLVNKFNLSVNQYDLYSLDLTNNEINLESLLKALKKYLEGKNYIYFFPSIPCLSEGKISTEKVETIININFNSFIKIFNCLLDRMKMTEVITYTSSIACIRPKSKNYLYSASKTGIESYLKSLMHYFKYEKPYIQIFRLGFISDNNTKKDLLKRQLSASPLKISNFIYSKNKESRSDLFYYPKKTVLLKFILMLMPRYLFKKLKI